MQQQAFITGATLYAERCEKLVEALDITLKAMVDLVRQLPTDERLADYNLDLCEIAEQKAKDALKLNS